MDRTERFYKINELLRTHKVVSFATLLAKVEASRSTLKRDLAYLCERLHIAYTSRGNGSATERDISTQRLVHYRDNW